MKDVRKLFGKKIYSPTEIKKKAILRRPSSFGEEAEDEVFDIIDVNMLVQRYQFDQTGIRNEIRMRYICIVCGSFDVKDKSSEEPYYKVCQKCNETWYINSCWNCANAWVDSRDPETPQCLSCEWYKCQVCGACSQLGCFTNPYSQNNRLRDLKKTGFDYTLTREENALLDQYYEFYKSLAAGNRQPTTPEQEHFIAVCQGQAKAKTTHERAYMKYRIIQAMTKPE